MAINNSGKIDLIATLQLELKQATKQLEEFKKLVIEPKLKFSLSSIQQQLDKLPLSTVVDVKLNLPDEPIRIAAIADLDLSNATAQIENLKATLGDLVANLDLTTSGSTTSVVNPTQAQGQSDVNLSALARAISECCRDEKRLLNSIDQGISKLTDVIGQKLQAVTAQLVVLSNQLLRDLGRVYSLMQVMAAQLAVGGVAVAPIGAMAPPAGAVAPPPPAGLVGAAIPPAGAPPPNRLVYQGYFAEIGKTLWQDTKKQIDDFKKEVVQEILKAAQTQTGLEEIGELKQKIANLRQQVAKSAAESILKTATSVLPPAALKQEPNLELESAVKDLQKIRFPISKADVQTKLQQQSSESVRKLYEELNEVNLKTKQGLLALLSKASKEQIVDAIAALEKTDLLKGAASKGFKPPTTANTKEEILKVLNEQLKVSGIAKMVSVLNLNTKDALIKLILKQPIDRILRSSLLANDDIRNALIPYSKQLIAASEQLTQKLQNATNQIVKVAAKNAIDPKRFKRIADQIESRIEAYATTFRAAIATEEDEIKRAALQRALQALDQTKRALYEAKASVEAGGQATDIAANLEQTVKGEINQTLSDLEASINAELEAYVNTALDEFTDVSKKAVSKIDDPEAGGINVEAISETVEKIQRQGLLKTLEENFNATLRQLLTGGRRKQARTKLQQINDRVNQLQEKTSDRIQTNTANSISATVKDLADIVAKPVRDFRQKQAAKRQAYVNKLNNDVEQLSKQIIKLIPDLDTYIKDVRDAVERNQKQDYKQRLREAKKLGDYGSIAGDFLRSQLQKTSLQQRGQKLTLNLSAIEKQIKEIQQRLNKVSNAALKEQLTQQLKALQQAKKEIAQATDKAIVSYAVRDIQQITQKIVKSAPTVDKYLNEAKTAVAKIQSQNLKQKAQNAQTLDEIARVIQYVTQARAQKAQLGIQGQQIKKDLVELEKQIKNIQSRLRTVKDAPFKQELQQQLKALQQFKKEVIATQKELAKPIKVPVIQLAGRGLDIGVQQGAGLANKLLGTVDKNIREKLPILEDSELYKKAIAGISGELEKVQQKGLKAFSSLSTLTRLTLGFGALYLAVTKLGPPFVQFVTMAIQAGQQALLLDSQFQDLRASLTYITGSTTQAAESLEFVRSVAFKTAQPIIDLGRNFVQLRAATASSNTSGQQINRLFENLTIQADALGLTTEDTRGIIIALGQTFSKGVVQAEELRGQIGERLPGAFKTVAQTIGVTEMELSKLMESGLFDPDTLAIALNRYAEAQNAFFSKVDFPNYADALQRLQNELQTFQTNTISVFAKLAIPLTELAAKGLQFTNNVLPGIIGAISDVLVPILGTLAVLLAGKLVPILVVDLYRILTLLLTKALIPIAEFITTTIVPAIASLIVKIGLFQTVLLGLLGLGVVAAIVVVTNAIFKINQATTDYKRNLEGATKVFTKYKIALAEAQEALNQFGASGAAELKAQEARKRIEEELGWIALIPKATEIAIAKATNEGGQAFDEYNQFYMKLVNDLSSGELERLAEESPEQLQVMLDQAAAMQEGLNRLSELGSPSDSQQAQINFLQEEYRKRLGQINEVYGLAAQIGKSAAKAKRDLDQSLIDIKQSEAQLEQKLNQQLTNFEITQAQADRKRSQERLNNLEIEKQQQQAIIASFDQQLKEENIRRLRSLEQAGKGIDFEPAQLTEPQRKAYNEAQTRLTEIATEQSTARKEIIESEYQETVDTLERQYNQALALQSQAEQERLIQIQEALNKGVINQQEADRLKLDSTKERLTRELQIEQTNLKEIGNLPIPQIEKDQKIRDSKLKISQLTLQLLEQEREQQERTRQSIEAANERSHSNRLKQIDLQTEALQRQEEALDRINKLQEAGADLAKAYNAAASAQIDSQVARLDRIGELIDAVKPELSDVQQKAIAARQKKAAGEELRRQGFDPSQESLGQFELRMARERYQLEEKSRQLKAEALKQEQTLARANLEIEKQKLVISQKRSQLEVEKELAELRRSKIEEQKNLRNAVSDEERAAIQETIRLQDQEIANAQERLKLLDEQYQQEQGILAIKEEQLRIEQESAKGQLANEQQLARTKGQTEYFGKGGRAADLMPRRDYNTGNAQSLEQLQQKYPGSRMDITQLQQRYPVPQMPDIIQGVERGNQPVISKLDALISAVNSKPSAQLNATNNFYNQFANANEKELLRKVRSQTAEDVSSIIKSAIGSIA